MPEYEDGREIMSLEDYAKLVQNGEDTVEGIIRNGLRNVEAKPYLDLIASRATQMLQSGDDQEKISNWIIEQISMTDFEPKASAKYVAQKMATLINKKSSTIPIKNPQTVRNEVNVNVIERMPRIRTKKSGHTLIKIVLFLFFCWVIISMIQFALQGGFIFH